MRKNKQHEIMLKKTVDSRMMVIGLVKKIKRHRHLLVHLCTAFFMLWFSMLLIYGVTSNVMNEFYRFIFFLRHPLVIILNSMALFAALIHTAMRFHLMSKAISNKLQSTKLFAIFVVTTCWLVTGLLSVFFISVILK